MEKSDLPLRALSTLVLWLGIVAVVVMNWHWALAVIIPLLGGLALWEFFAALENKGIRTFKHSATWGGALFLFGSWLILSRTISGVPYATFEQTALLLLLLANLTRGVFDENQRTPIITMAVSLFGLLYIAWLFNFVTRLVYFPGVHEHRTMLLLYLLATTKMSDIGAYLSGKTFGRHKMLPRVSPKKTWEGFAGGLLASILTSYLLVASFPDSLGIIGPWALSLGCLIALVSVLGDLAESVLKRDAAIKDSGRIIPGIGGILDLIDSVLFTAPVLFVFLIFRSLNA